MTVTTRAEQPAVPPSPWLLSSPLPGSARRLGTLWGNRGSTEASPDRGPCGLWLTLDTRRRDDHAGPAEDKRTASVLRSCLPRTCTCKAAGAGPSTRVPARTRKTWVKSQTPSSGLAPPCLPRVSGVNQQRDLACASNINVQWHRLDTKLACPEGSRLLSSHARWHPRRTCLPCPWCPRASPPVPGWAPPWHLTWKTMTKARRAARTAQKSLEMSYLCSDHGGSR